MNEWIEMEWNCNGKKDEMKKMMQNIHKIDDKMSFMIGLLTDLQLMDQVRSLLFNDARNSLVNDMNVFHFLFCLLVCVCDW